MIPTLAPYLLPRVVPALKRAYPKLELLLYEVQTAPMLAQIERGELELGLLALPVEGEGLHTEELLEEPFYLAVPSTHALAQRSQVSLADLRDETILLLDDGHCFRDQALELCFKGGAREKSSFRGTSLETLRQMVRAGSGLTLLPELAVEADPHPEGVVYLPFEAPMPRRVVGLIYRESSARRSAFEALGQTIRAQPSCITGLISSG